MLNNVMYFQPPSISHQQKNVEKGNVRDTSIIVSKLPTMRSLRRGILKIKHIKETKGDTEFLIGK